jgi:Na+/H+ antiporter NhaC
LFGDFYEKVNLNTAGIVFALVIVLIMLLFLTIKKMVRASLEACEQLNEQYQLLKN